MAERIIRGILMHPGCEPHPVEIAAGLDNMQAMVGGLIECLAVDGFDVWMNEEGRLIGLPECVRWEDAEGNECVLVGPLFVAATNDEGETVSLTDEQERAALAWLRERACKPVRYNGPEFGPYG